MKSHIVTHDDLLPLNEAAELLLEVELGGHRIKRQQLLSRCFQMFSVATDVQDQ